MHKKKRSKIKCQNQVLLTKNRWKKYAAEFLNQTNYLGDKVLILFDKWISDQEYRKQIAIDLGFEFSDSGFQKMGQYGSSFNTGVNLDSLKSRFEMYQDDEFFQQNVMMDQELLDLYNLMEKKN